MPVALPRSAWPSRQGVASFIAALLLAAFLTGCGSAETALQLEAGRQLQTRVLQVSEAAAANDRVAALKALDALAVDLEARAGRGEVSADRRRQIATVIAAVRADLTGTQVTVQSADIKPVEAESPSAAAEPAQHQEEAPAAPDQALDVPAYEPPPAPADPAPAAVDPAAAPIALAPSDTSTKGNGDKGNDDKGKKGKGQDN